MYRSSKPCGPGPVLVLVDTESVKQNQQSLVESHWNLHTYWASRECVALEDPLRIPTGLPPLLTLEDKLPFV